MKTFITVLKNNYLRTKPRMILVAVMTVIALASTVLAVYLTGLHQVKGRVLLVLEDSADTGAVVQEITSVTSPSTAPAVVPKIASSTAPADEPGTVPATSPSTAFSVRSKYLKITVSDRKPPYSALVEQKYDAYAILGKDGSYRVETLKSKEYKDMLVYLLQNPDAEPPKLGTERGVGVNILGFMMMFLLMLSFSNLFVFAEDKEQGQIKKVFAAPASFGGYLAAHVVYCLSLLLPEYILLALLKLGGRNIGFSLPIYGGLIAVTGFLGISVAMLLYVLIQKADNATMLGNSITVLATVLSGSFYSFSRNNELLDHIIKILPQKELMDFAQYLEQGKGMEHILSFLYVIVFSLILFAVSCKKLRNMYVRKI